MSVSGSGAEPPSGLDLAVRGARVVAAGGTLPATVGIRDGRIALLADPALPVVAREVLDATGLTLLPGLVDAHVHMRAPGFEHKEGFGTGSMAAAAGGVTTVMVMPTTDPPTLTVRDFDHKVRLAAGRAHVDFALQAGVGGGGAEVEALAARGVVSFELFLGDAAPALLLAEDAELREALRLLARVDRVAGVTPTVGAVIHAETARLRAAGRREPAAFARSRPPIAEALGVARVALLAEETGARVHFRQLSCRAAIDVLRAARVRYPRLSAETTPHNLLLHEEELERQGPFAKVAPPLRTPADAASLWEALRDGSLDIVATDHAPHLPHEKEAGRNDIWKAPGGFPGLQTFLPLMLDEVARGRWTLGQLVRCCAETPARLFGLYPRKGAIALGADADLVAVDLGRTLRIENETQYSRARVTPFAGRVVTGCPVLTMVRGQVVMREGQIAGPPRGTLVTPVGPAGGPRATPS
jgi:dihydroorotase